jgi:hypothetical protein
MEAFWPPQSSNGRRDPEFAHKGDVRTLTDAELEAQVRVGWDTWCDLLDDLLNTGGMLPSRRLAGRVVGFFEDSYWCAEDARVEALRREMASRHPQRRHGADRSRGIR